MKSRNILKGFFINKDFTLLWIGQSVSIFGNFFMFLALPILTYNITGSKLTLAITISLQAVPAILVGPFAGALVDRWDRKRVMIVTDILRALILVPIILVKGDNLVYAVYSVSFFLSLVGIFFEPAYGAAIPKIVGKDNILKANSRIQTTVSVIKILAPLVGTAVLTILGVEALIIIDVLSFIISAATIIFITTGLKVHREGEISFSSITKDIADGVRYALERKSIAVVLLAFLFLAFFEGIMQVLLLPYIKDVLKAGEEGFGFAIAVQGVGQILGSIIIGIAGSRIKPEKIFAICFSGTAVTSILFVNATSLAMAVPILCIIGIFIVGLFISVNTIIQSLVEDQFLGRIENSLGILFQFGILTTALLTGIASEAYGIRLILNIGAGIEIIGMIITISLLKGRRRKVSNLAAEGE